jgi:hypothetical protein
LNTVGNTASICSPAGHRRTNAGDLPKCVFVEVLGGSKNDERSDQVSAGRQAGLHPKQKGSGETPKPFCLESIYLQINGCLFACFSFALSNVKHFFGGLGQSPKDEGNGQDDN